MRLRSSKGATDMPLAIADALTAEAEVSSEAGGGGDAQLVMVTVVVTFCLSKSLPLAKSFREYVNGIATGTAVLGRVRLPRRDLIDPVAAMME